MFFNQLHDAPSSDSHMPVEPSGTTCQKLSWSRSLQGQGPWTEHSYFNLKANGLQPTSDGLMCILFVLIVLFYFLREVDREKTAHR